MTVSFSQEAFPVAFVCILSLLVLLVLGSSISILFFIGKDGTYTTTRAPVRPSEPTRDSIPWNDNAALQKNITSLFSSIITGIIAWVFTTQGLALARSYFDYPRNKV